MIEQDTVRLLRECDAGIKMGISSIEDVYSHIRNDKMRTVLTKSKDEHSRLQEDVVRELTRFGDEGKEPNGIAEGMSQLKTGLKLAVNDSDQTVAELMTDGCNMGIKSLSGYLNKYKAADERSKDLTKKLIKTEEELCKAMRVFL